MTDGLTEDPDRSPEHDAPAETFDDFFRQWDAPLRRWLRREGAWEDDLVDYIAVWAFLAVDRAWQRIEPAARRRYLFRVAGNMTKKLAPAWRERQKALQQAVTELARGIHAGGDLPHDAGDAAKRERCTRLLDHLSPRQREALTYHLGEGLSYKQTSERMGTTEGSVKSQVSTGLTKLRALARTTHGQEEA